MAASTTLQSAVVEKAVIRLLEQLATTQQMVQPATGMLVLLQDNLPPMSWRLGIISEMFPGSDGYVRVVTVKTSSGQLKRPIHKLVSLPVK